MEIDLPWEGHEDVHSTFDAWVEHGCTHSGMRLVSESIGSWGGYRLFQAALRTRGERIAFLLQTIPNSNGGSTSPIDAQCCLTLLEEFAAQEAAGSMVRLIDVDSSKGLAAHIDIYEGIYLIGDGYEGGVDLRGFFLRSQYVANRELFRSMRFEQAQLNSNVFELRALDGSGTITLNTAIGMEITKGVARYPKRLAVVQNPDHPKNHTYIISALRSVFSASIATGNPVVWS